MDQLTYNSSTLAHISQGKFASQMVDLLESKVSNGLAVPKLMPNTQATSRVKKKKTTSMMQKMLWASTLPSAPSWIHHLLRSMNSPTLASCWAQKLTFWCYSPSITQLTTWICLDLHYRLWSSTCCKLPKILHVAQLGAR